MPTRIQILRGQVHQVTFSQAINRVQALLESPGPHQIVTANTLMLLASERDRELAEILEKASLVVPESWGVAWASRRLATPLQEFIPGIDFMNELCQLASEHGHSVYLLGAKPGIAAAAAANLQEMHPGLKVSGAHHGYFFREGEEDAVVAAIRAAAPRFLFVGMTVPAQEKWIARRLKDLNVPIVMGVGGSFDVLSGQLRRAPAWMRRLGVEWVFRTLQQPWRVQRIKDLPVFMYRVLKQAR